MFERFTADARGVVVRAQEQARRLGSPQVGPTHLWLALIEGTEASQDPLTETLTDELAGALVDAGLTTERLESTLRTGSGSSGESTTRQAADDAEVLRAIGIDLDRIRASVEATFGPGALDRVGSRPRRRTPRWLRLARRGDGSARVASGHGPRRGHIPFATTAKVSLELALREAIRLRSREIRSEHLALGLIRADHGEDAPLTRLAVDGAALRAVLERRLRRSA